MIYRENSIYKDAADESNRDVAAACQVVVMVLEADEGQCRCSSQADGYYR